MNYLDLTKTRFFQFSDVKPTLEKEFIQGDNWQFFCDNFENWFVNLQGKTITNPIPKKIHQIWIGSVLPEKYIDWCNSWKILNPDWEYKLWNEKDILEILSPASKKAFLESVSFGPKGDIARYAILEKFGGVYCDTDFECVKPLDFITNSCTLFSANIFSDKPQMAGGIIGAIPHHPMIIKVSQELEKPITTTNSAEILELSGPFFLTKVITENKNLLLPEDSFFPSHYFYPYPNFCVTNKKSPTKIKQEFLKPVSFGIHYWEVSWEKHDFFYYLKKIIKTLILYKYWSKLIA